MKRKNYFLLFLKGYWWLILVLALLLIIPVLVYCVIFQDSFCDASAWASIIAGIATYLGSAFLGVLVFYNTWYQVEKNNEVESIDVTINLEIREDNGLFVPFTKDELETQCTPNFSTALCDYKSEYKNKRRSYLKFNITNNNYYTPINVELTGIYFVDLKFNLLRFKWHDTVSNINPKSNIDHNTKAVIYCGVDSDFFDKKFYNCLRYLSIIVVFKVKHPKGIVKYITKEYCIGKEVLCSERILSEKQYNKNILKHKVPVQLTYFNKQFKKRGDKSEI